MAVTCSNLVPWLNAVKLPDEAAESIYHACQNAAPHITKKNVFLAYIVYRIIKFIIIAIYRLTFHPLARFPGPFLAKISPLYEMYYAVYKDGQMTIHCHEVLHPKYGPIVRTMPNILRINDPEAFHQIHFVGTPFTKAPFYAGLKAQKSTFGATDPKVHKVMRSNVSSMFSRQAVKKHEPVVLEKAALMLERMDQCIAEGEEWGVMKGRPLYFAFLFDVISDYAFAGRYDLLKLPVIEHRVIDALALASESTMFLKYFTPVLTIMESLPLWLAQKIAGPVMAGQEELRQSLELEIKNLEARRKSGNFKANEGKPTVMSDLMDKGVDVATLAQEGHTLIGAALDTTAWTLMSATYQMGANPTIQTKLYHLLKDLSPNKDALISWSQAETIPYIAAVVKELLRITTSVAGPLPRITPPTGATLLSTPIPPNTELETNIYSLHHNAAIFPNPEKFDPERWLAPNAKQLERYLVPFSAGTRGCVGLHFAYMNIFVGLCAVVRRFEIGLTREMESEGWRWTEKWVCAKRGCQPDFRIRKRGE